MILFHIIILAIVQGITEFLPISSSGHLSLLHHVFGGETSQETNHLFDIAVHVGTLFAVLLYFWKDLWSMLSGIVCFKNAEKKQNGMLAWKVGVASLPVIFAGLVLHAYLPSFLSLLSVVAVANIVYALFLWWADKRPVTQGELSTITWKQAGLIGLSQTLALIPGTSRSGVTMTTARFLGFDRTVSAKFSMFLGIVAISGAGLLGALDIDWANTQLGIDLGLAVIFSFLSALVAIALMMRWLAKASFTPFVIYRLIFGVGLLVFLAL
jgi:undecaprenyl-diphosphatase